MKIRDFVIFVPVCLSSKCFVNWSGSGEAKVFRRF